MSRIVSYGFPLAKAQTLSRMADQEATRTRSGPSVTFGEPTGEGPQIVQIWDGSSSIGDLVSPNADGYHAARLRFFGDGTSNNVGMNAWLAFIDWEDGDLAQVVGECGRYFVSVPMGNVTSGGVEKPAYLTMSGEMSFICKPDSSISKGSSGTVSLYHRSSETDSTINLTAKALGAAVTSGKWCTVTRVRGGQTYVLPWEC